MQSRWVVASSDASGTASWPSDTKSLSCPERLRLVLILVEHSGQGKAADAGIRTHPISGASLKPGFGGCGCSRNALEFAECGFGDPMRQEKYAVHMAKGAVVCRVQDCRKGKPQSKLALKGEDCLPGDVE